MRKEAIILLFKDGISVLLFYFLAKLWWGKEGWFNDKLHEMLTFLLIGLVFYIISLGLALVTRPIILEVSQINKRFQQPHTNFSIQSNRKTQEHERIVDLKLSITKNNSLWIFLFGKYLNRCNLSILVESVTVGLVLQADNEGLRNDIDTTAHGFILKIDTYIDQIITRSNIGQHSKGCEYLILENSTNYVSDETIHIVPILLSNGRPASSFLKFLIRFNTPEHIVNFKWEV